ncbi:unnamed protein product [Lactuca virosa]|uniref:Uncharacterized protein n=1 Tax=Lactuca virosa TaxID=75947 RepID=A0AAU9MMT5_9ASTR|nr:unnamed protein product [Lactuca virosa]
MKEGLSGVIDHVLESLEFGYGVNKFQDVCLAAGNVLGMQEAKELIGGGSKLEDALEDDVDHEAIIDEALDAFASLDYASVFDLEKLNVEKLKQMVQAYGYAGPS